MNRAQVFAVYSLRGRAGRREFLLTHAYVAAITIITIICTSGLLPGSLGKEVAEIWSSLFIRPLLFFLLFDGASQEQLILLGLCGAFWAGVMGALGAVAVRRLHDRGRTGFWIILMAVSYFLRNIPRQILFALPVSQHSLPYVLEVFRIVYVLAMMAYILELGAYPGQRGDNKFGAEPLESQLNRT